MSSDLLIEIDHVTFGYDERRTILNDLSLRFERGKVTSVLGGSGCGKTTLLRLIGGVHGADSGRVVFDGTPAQLTTSVARDIYGADASFNESATSTSIDGPHDAAYADAMLA